MSLSDQTRQQMLKFQEATHKKFGAESLHLLGQASKYIIDVIPTGSVALDVALGVGGIPRGRVVEIYGPESSGKTTLCQHIIAEAQKLGGYCVFIDVENALDPVYAKACGVDIENLFVSQPESGEQALEITQQALEFNPMVVVIDSVAGLVPRAEIEGQMGDAHMALQARLMSQALRKLTAPAKKSNTTIIFTNQIRQKIGVFFGPSETTTGGMALRFWASIRLECRAKTVTKEDEEAVARDHDITVKKNKVASPFKKATLTIRLGEGISQVDELIIYVDKTDLLFDFIEKAGAWYTIKTDPPMKVSGKANLREKLLEDIDLLLELENTLRGKLRLPLKIKE